MPSLCREIPATLPAMEALCQELRHWMAEQGSAWASRCFATELVAREALANAVLHGCSKASDGHVQLALHLGPRRLRLRIKDPGPGFDWQHQEPASPDGDAPRGRGLFIFQRYTSRLLYNHAGNQLLLVIDNPGVPHVS